MFVGYAKDHSEDVFRFLKMGTKKIVLSRDVIWLNKLYFHYKNSLKSNSFQSYQVEEEVFDTVKKLNKKEHQESNEPAMEQEGQEEILQEEEKLFVEADTEVPEENTRPRATKKIPMELRKLC